MKKDKSLSLAVLFSLISVGVHAYLSSHYYDLKLGAASGGSFCNINSYLNCDAVTASKYSTFLGVPMAIWGFFTNLIAAYIFSVARFNLSADNERTARYGFVFSLAIFATSLIMGSISLILIGNICLFCVSVYVLSFLTFVTAGFGIRWNIKSLARDIKDLFKTQKWILGCLIAIPAFSYTAHSMILESHGFSNIAKLVNEKIAYWQVAPEQKFDPTQGLILQKKNDTPVVMTIVEFADFRCPHCRDAYPALHAFTESHPDVRLIFKPFPLDGTCNAALTGGDGISCALAFITQCAEKIGKKGWQVHNYLFDNQETFRSLPLAAAADKVCAENGLNCDELKTCAKSDETVLEVKNLASEGAAAKIQGTPSIFVNSKILSGGQLLPILDEAYRKIKGL